LPLLAILCVSCVGLESTEVDTGPTTGGGQLTRTWYRDADEDGYGDATATSVDASQPTGYVEDNTDCDDSDPAVHPEAAEYCNGDDDDCDGEIDEDAVDMPYWYPDYDGDGYGNDEVWFEQCDPYSDYVTLGGDCDDFDATVSPGTDELCDGADNDCDDLIDEEALDAVTWYIDQDGDGYGTPSRQADACSQPIGYASSENETDCDDFDRSIHPGADEYCDGEDNDCDGEVDEGTPVDAPSWYPDGDGDGYGDPDSPRVSCDQPVGHLPNGGDCDDGNAKVNPAATEYCDGVDNDCDGTVDGSGAVDSFTWYQDSDGDSYGDASSYVVVCDQPEGYVADDTDCDDGDASVNPAAVEICWDGVDDDCDGADQLCSELSLSEAWASLYGEGSDDGAGSGVAFAGDVNGDGFDDILVGADGEDAGGSSAGAVYLVHGPVSGELSLSSAQAKLTGAAAADYAGFQVSSAGDTDGDGYDDLLVGAYGVDSVDRDAGAAYLVLGPVSGSSSLSAADVVLWGVVEQDLAGYSVAAAGDVDADGYDDFLVGAYREDTGADRAGSAYLLLGPLGSDTYLSAADAQLTGEAASDDAGIALAGAGDVDGDGQDDLLIGAYGEDSGGSSAGAAYLVLGPVSLSQSLSSADAKLTGAASGDYAGRAVAGAGDVDGDGHDDLLVGAYGEDSGGTTAGAAYLVLGPVSGELSLAAADAILSGESDATYAGRDVAGAGDLNQDGHADLLVGAWGYSSGGSNIGAGYLVLGPVSGSLDLSAADALLTGENSGDYAGLELAGGGDSDGDGYPDLLIAAEGGDGGGSSAGTAYLMKGAGF